MSQHDKPAYQEVDDDVISLKQLVLAIARHKWLVMIVTFIALIVGILFAVYRHEYPHYLVQATIKPAYTIKGAQRNPIQSSDQLKQFLHYTIDNELNKFDIDYMPQVEGAGNKSTIERPVNVWTNQGGNDLIVLRAKAGNDHLSNYKQFYHHAFEQLKQYQQKQGIHLFANNQKQNLQQNKDMIEFYTSQFRSAQDLLDRSHKHLRDLWQLSGSLSKKNQTNSKNEGQFFQLLMSNNLISHSQVSSQLMQRKDKINDRVASLKHKKRQINQQLDSIHDTQLQDINIRQLPATISPMLMVLIFLLIGLVGGCLLAILVDQMKDDDSSSSDDQ